MERPGFHVLRDRGDGNRNYSTDFYWLIGRNRYVAVAEESAFGAEGGFFAVGKGVAQNHPGVGDAEIAAVNAPFGAVHAARVGPVAVVEQFARQAGEIGALFGFKRKFWYSGAVLAEIHYERFARLKADFVAGFISAQFVHLTVGVSSGSVGILPYVDFYRIENQVIAEIYLPTFRWENLALKFGVDFRCFKAFDSIETHRAASVVFLAVENVGVGHRSADACEPVGGIGAESLRSAVVVSELQHPAESRFVSGHSLASGRSHDLIGPPARSRLYGQRVCFAAVAVEHIGYIVGKRAFCFQRVRESRFENLLAHAPPVDVGHVDAQAGGHP